LERYGNKFAKWLVGLSLPPRKTLAEAGPPGHPRYAARPQFATRAKVDCRANINELESRVKHDVIAFTMAVGESIADPGRRALAALRLDIQ